MARDLHRDPAEHQDKDTQAAGGGPVGIAPSYYAELAARLLDNGYAPIPIHPGSKKPVPKGWPGILINAAQVEAWERSCGHCGIGLRTGHLVGIDIDHLDPLLSHQLAIRAIEMFGPTLIRVGRWPKRLLIYRIDTPIAKLSVPHVEILGAGQQFLAHGIHPDTGNPYEWITGEGPCEVPFDQLPLVDESGLHAFLAEASALTAHQADERRPRRDGQAGVSFNQGPTRGTDGRVIDGRDGWLSSIAFHTVHDALDRAETLAPLWLAQRVWARFAATTDLGRPQKDGGRRWTRADAEQKVRDKLDLLQRDRLPSRDTPSLQPEDLGELLPSDVARTRLGAVIDLALANATAWWSSGKTTGAPVVGIRATVGLGKSAVSREKIAAWQRDMKQFGLPHRVLVLTPSHALAEEAAVDWAAKVEGPVAVHRGYNAHDPGTQAPMCRDHEVVRLALREHLGVGKSVCYSSKKWHCQFYVGCLKQANKQAVAAADVVLAPYDVLFTGIGAGDVPFGLLVIDEGCWQRAEETTRCPPVEKLATAGLSGLGSDDPNFAAAMADLVALRAKAKSAFTVNGPGPVCSEALVIAGLNEADCEAAAALEGKCIHDPNIYAGMKPRARRQATEIVKRNEVARRMAALWRALANLLGGNHSGVGLLHIDPPHPETEEHRIVLHDHLRLAEPFKGLPILHLDATLREELARLILPGLEVTRIEAEQPNLRLTLVTGRFGKSTLSSSPDLRPDEQQRRQNRLREVVEYVQWQARRFGSKGVLVVTNKDIESAFIGIEDVQTAHFNAIAGLDQYRDVALLIVVGRPLPPSEAMQGLTASFFHEPAEGRYRFDWRAVHLRSGGTTNIRVVAHEDPKAELLRSAICNDEVIQAVGRGRGVNRSADNPLEVHVLADVALPLVHDRVVAWEAVVPDVLQRMLLAGIAVDSPADAATLHPDLFSGVEQAKKAFQRGVFQGHFPVGNPYREMSLKSARYRRGGRGRSWQRAWWIGVSSDGARRALEVALGALSGWKLLYSE